MATQYPLLFICSRNRGAKLKDYMERVEDQVVWAPILGRNLTEIEEGQLIELLIFLQNIRVNEEE